MNYIVLDMEWNQPYSKYKKHIGSMALRGEIIQIGAVKLIIARAEDMSADDIRSLGDKAKEQGDDVVAVIACVNNEKGSANIAVACGKAAVAAGANAGAIVRAVAQLAGGNGGGKPDFAMAGAKDLAKLDDAVAAANGIVAGMLK